MRSFHAGTRADGKRILANGGRVLNVTGFGPDVRIAREKAYAGVDAIDFVIFPPRILAMENTFRPPWFHRSRLQF